MNTNIELKYDQPIEVSETAFNIIMNQLSGTCCGRKEDNGKYYIKPWMMGYINEIKNVIAQNSLNKN